MIGIMWQESYSGLIRYPETSLVFLKVASRLEERVGSVLAMFHGIIMRNVLHVVIILTKQLP